MFRLQTIICQLKSSKDLVSRIVHNHPALLKKTKNFHRSAIKLNINRPKNMREETFRMKDKISEKYQIIYRAPMEHYLSFSKHFTTFSVVCIGTIVAIRHFMGLQYIDSPESYGGLQTDEFEMIMFAVGFAVITLVLRGFVNQYPLRIYKAKTNYTAVFEGNYPFSKKYLEFSKGDVELLPIKGILPWNDAKYSIKNHNVVLLVNYFRSPSELSLMMDKNNNP